MAGHIRKRTYKNKQGKVTGEGYQARYEDPTDPSRRVEKTFRTKRDANDWLATQRTSVLSGTHVDPRRGDRPFAAVVDAWRASWIGLEPKTRQGYESILHKHLIPTFGKRRVSTITPEVVQAYINQLSADGLAPATVRSVYSVLRSALTTAVRLRMLASSPCVGVKLPRATKNEQHYLDASQVTRLAEAIDPHYRVAV